MTVFASLWEAALFGMASGVGVKLAGWLTDRHIISRIKRIEKYLQKKRIQ